MSKRVKLPEWRVIRISSRGQRLATVEAGDADDAINKIVKQYELDAEAKKRLAAYRVS